MLPICTYEVTDPVKVFKWHACKSDQIENTAKMSDFSKWNVFIWSIKHISVTNTVTVLIESGLVSQQICYLRDVTLVAWWGVSLLWKEQNTYLGLMTLKVQIEHHKQWHVHKDIKCAPEN